MVRLTTGTEGRNRKNPFHFLVPIYCPLSKYIVCLHGMLKIASSMNKNSQKCRENAWKMRCFRSLFKQVLTHKRLFLTLYINTMFASSECSKATSWLEQFEFCENRWKCVVFQEFTSHLFYPGSISSRCEMKKLSSWEIVSIKDSWLKKLYWRDFNIVLISFRPNFHLHNFGNFFLT